MISETRIDDSFPTIDGFSTPFWSDCDVNVGRIMLYVREDIPANLLTTGNALLESLYIKSNLRNTKWLSNCTCNPGKNMIEQHLVAVDDLYSLNCQC